MLDIQSFDLASIGQEFIDDPWSEALATAIDHGCAFGLCIDDDAVVNEQESIALFPCFGVDQADIMEGRFHPRFPFLATASRAIRTKGATIPSPVPQVM